MSIISPPEKRVERAEHPTYSELMEALIDSVQTAMEAIAQIVSPAFDRMIEAVHHVYITALRQALFIKLSRRLPSSWAWWIAQRCPEWLLVKLRLVPAFGRVSD